MRNEIFIGSKSYSKETLLLDTSLLCLLQKMARDTDKSVSEIINNVLERGLDNATIQ